MGPRPKFNLGTIIIKLLINTISRDQNLLVGGGRVDTEQSVDSYTLLLWSSLFYVLENFSSAEIAEPGIIFNKKNYNFAFLSAYV